MSDSRAGVQLLQVDAWADWPWLRHGFSTRQGGVSEGPYESLNMGAHVGDVASRVETNRQSWYRALGVHTFGHVLMQQVHGSTVQSVVAAGVCANTDGVISRVAGLVLHVLVADCLPILFVDPVTRAIGAVHAGWRGSVHNIVGKAVETLQAEYGVVPSNLQAAIGPGIGPCCYLVDEPVIAALGELPANTHQAAQQAETPNQWQLDLFTLNTLLLQNAGLKRENVHTLGYCTMDHADLFFSYRRDAGHTGRLIGSIALLKE